MIMRRKITDIIKKWSLEDSKECALLIDGARRVGKSFIVEEFAKAEYPAYLMINFKYVGHDIKETFAEYLSDIDRFFERLFLVLNRKQRGNRVAHFNKEKHRGHIDTVRGAPCEDVPNGL